LAESQIVVNSPAGRQGLEAELTESQIVVDKQAEVDSFGQCLGE